MNIYQRMSAITQEISTVAKNLMVGEGKSKYKAVGEADVLAAVKPIEAKYGVYSYPVIRTVIDSGEMTSVSEYNGNRKETKRLFLRVETVYRFVNVDQPDEYIDLTTYGDGVDTQDKAPGKAMTYSDKYALLKAYKIQTGEDPDQQASEPLEGLRKKVIGESERQTLIEMCRQKGYTPETVFPKGLDLTPEQYVQAVKTLEKLNGNARQA